jgi:hypothetical protein
MVQSERIGQYAIRPDGTKGQQGQSKMRCQYEGHNYEDDDPGKDFLQRPHPALGKATAALLDGRILFAL